MNLQEMFEKMASGAMKAHSELDTRDERRQNRSFGARFSKLKPSVGIDARALVMKDVVLPFNPFTLEEDDNYNAKTPFRPILLVTQVIELIKHACAENSELAEKWSKFLNGSMDWNGLVTLDDYYLLKGTGVIKPRIMTYDTVRVSFNGRNGLPEFPSKYLVDSTKLDPVTRTFPDFRTAPIYHKGAAFFNALLRPAADEAGEKVKRSGGSKETIANARRTVFSKSPLGFVSPTNLVPFFYFPLSSEPKELKEGDFSAVESCVRYMSWDKSKWATAMDEISKKNNLDEDIDFFDLTIKTPSDHAQKSDGSVYTDEDTLQLYQALTITVTDGRQSLHASAVAPTFDPIVKRIEEYFIHSQEESSKTDGDTFEKIMASSNRFRPIESILDSLAPACNEVFMSFCGDDDLKKYITSNLKKQHADFLTAINPDNALALAAEDEEDLDAAANEAGESIQGLILADRALQEEAPPEIL